MTSHRLRLPGICLALWFGTTCLAGSVAAPFNQAGFMEIEPVTFYLHFGSYLNRLQLTSSPARLWYSFQAADADEPGRPLFVFFNGGPGSATSCGLMSMNTGRWTLDNRIDGGGGNFIANPCSWTRMGHLLYIDAREAGFSYNRMDNAGDGGARLREFNSQNFNCFFDAADFIRVLLRFLAAHPVLQNRPVVIVGESYGGTRAIAMMHILLHYSEYGNGLQMYQDPALAAEIQAHYEAVFPGTAGAVVPAQVIGRQFGHQVLIQPTVSFGYQEEIANRMLSLPGSALYRIAAETGLPYDPGRYPDPLEYVDAAGRDYYIYSKPSGWLNSFFANAGRLLRFTANLARVCGTDVLAIPGFFAAARTGAYRVVDTTVESAAAGPDAEARFEAEAPPLLRSTGRAGPVTAPSAATRALFLAPAEAEASLFQSEPGDMAEAFGALQPWDRFFMGSNGYANWAFHVFNVARLQGYDIHYYDPRFGGMFLDNAAHTQVFITNAALDLVVFTPALPPALARHGDIVSEVIHQTTGAEERPGRIVLRYRAGAIGDAPGTAERVIRFPLYERSCHAVSLTQPEELFDDVSAWLLDGGLAVAVAAGR